MPSVLQWFHDHITTALDQLIIIYNFVCYVYARKALLIYSLIFLRISHKFWFIMFGYRKAFDAGYKMPMLIALDM